MNCRGCAAIRVNVDHGRGGARRSRRALKNASDERRLDERPRRRGGARAPARVVAALRALTLLGALGSTLATVGACSSAGEEPVPAQRLPPSVTFAYPRDGQLDVPVGTRLVFQLSEAVDDAALAAPCTGSEGALCVVGPAGPVSLSITVTGERKNLLQVQAALAPGETYRVYARPNLISAPSALSATDPLLTFRTRQPAIAAGAPQLVAVNADDPRAFLPGGPTPRFPILDRSTLRLLFSEPLDERSVVPGQSVTLRVAGAATTVPATVLALGQHLVIDPDADLTPDGRYELVLTGLTDRSGAALPAATLTFVAAAATATYEQVVELDQPGSESGPGVARSSLTGAPINSVSKRAPIIGSAELGLLPGTLRAELGDPSAFGGPIPFTLRKGQRLTASELPLRLAGVVGLGYRTGSLRFELVTDASGWVTRNPYRPADTRPDDRDAPLAVELFFDAALTAEDATGNALATQTVLGVHLVGAATAADGQLALEVAGALEVELLGVTRSHADISLRLRTGATPQTASEGPPRILSTRPARGDGQVAVDTRLQVVTSSAIDLGKVRAAGQLALSSSAGVVPIDVQAAGAALVVVPRQSLQPGTAYTLRLGPLVDVAGRAVTPGPGDPTGGTGLVTFTTAPTPGGTIVPPQLAAAVPGAPCPLTGASAAGPGHCVAGGDSDPSYRPFELAADRPIDLWFTQPMSAASLRLGTACGSGAVRVERLDAGGACVQAVPGELTLRDNGLRFTPLARWAPQTRYRVVLNAGTDATCNVGEVCGANGRPLNTDALRDASSEGGAAVVLPFTGVTAGPTTYLPLSSLPLTDRNGNGYIDAGEVRQPDNQLAVEVASTSGDITAASLAGADCDAARPGNQVCIGVAAELPVTVLPKVESCPVTATGAPATGAPPCVPVRISPQSVRVTSLTINATASILGVDIDIRNVQTGLMHLRLMEPIAAGAVGHILDDGAGKPVFVIAAQTLMDAPDLSIPLVSHDVRSKPINLTLVGPVTFSADGRMRVELHNRGNVIIPVHITAIGVDGYINLRVPDGTLTLSLVSPPPR